MTDLLSAKEAAETLGVSHEWIHRYRRLGMLQPSFTAGRMHLYSTDALHDLIDQLDETRRAEIDKLRANLPARTA